MDKQIEFGFVNTNDILKVLKLIHYHKSTQYKARKIFTEFRRRLEIEGVRMIDRGSIGADDFIRLFNIAYGVPLNKLERVVLEIFRNKKDSH